MRAGVALRAAVAWLALLGSAAAAPPRPAPAPPPKVDHHQHLLSASMTAPGQKPIDAKALVAMLDAAGIKRAVLLSNAYRFGSPFLETPFTDEYSRVALENDWTMREAAKYPKRLVAFCGFNPLKDYALGELARCARDPRFGRGIKLQFGNSGVDVQDPVDLARLRRVFRAANTARMALVIHVRPGSDRPWGAAQAQTFLDELLPAVPDIVVQIAHLGGGGGGELDAAAEQALSVFASAFIRKDARVNNLWFDVSGITGGANSAARGPVIAQLLRAIGTKHLLYGSDGGDPTDPPAKAALESFRRLPLMPIELRAIEANVAPYLPR
ncbi:MAG TPA: amidohydrolase family protein [Steroidobacteraceae bacterium]|nr:amidohydrolase family protein [Steroidobacteraceae bacterium]